MSETDRPQMEDQITSAVRSLAYRDARAGRGGDVAMWQPRNLSADRAVIPNAPLLRARARDLVRNNAHAKNAVRMNDDAVAGSGMKLALKIDWRSLGINDIEVAAEWQDSVVRAWEAHAESTEFQSDARRLLTFSELFTLVNRTKFVDGEALAIVEAKPGIGAYRTCLNLIDIDRLSNPDARADEKHLRAGVESDTYGEPVAYYIRNSHPADLGLDLSVMQWQRVPRSTWWGRPIVLHTYDMLRPEMSRGVSEFASAIIPFRMLGEYRETELQSAITQASYTATIKTELDWSKAMDVIGQKARSALGAAAGSNPIVDMMTGALAVAGEYYDEAGITFNGNKIPHLLPNESLEFNKPTHPNQNFEHFENAFLRNLAAGLGVEAHELAKNYREVNYSAARAALLAVWRTYRARRVSLVNKFAMPFFGAWLEEAVAIGMVKLPPGVPNFIAARPYLVKGTFIAWGKPMIDPYKERQAQQLGVQMGVETVESIVSEDGSNWRDIADQIKYEKTYFENLGLVYTANLPPSTPEPAQQGEQVGAV